MKKSLNRVYYNPPEIAKTVAKKYISYKYNDLVVSSAELKCVASLVEELEENVANLQFNDQFSANPFPDAHCRRFPLFLFRRPFVAEIQNGGVVGPNGAVITSDNQIIADSLKFPARHHDLHGAAARAVFSKPYFKSIAHEYRHQSKTDLSSAVVLHHGAESTGFYHWIIDNMLRLRSVRVYEELTGNNVTLILSAHAPDFVYDLLDYAGFGDNDVVLWDGQWISVENMVIPSWPEPTPKNLDWLKTKVSSNLEHSKISRYVKQVSDECDYIYISRQKASKRVVKNYNEIKPILNKYNIKEIKFSNLNIESEIHLIRSITGIIGPHGAGLTSMIWADDLSVLEIFNGVVIPPFFVIADVLDFEYSAIMAEPIEGNRVRDRDIYVDPDVFENHIENFVK